MGRRKRIPDDLMSAILSEGTPDPDDGGFPYSGDSSGANESQSGRVGITFNLSKRLGGELEKLRERCRPDEDSNPSRSEIVEAALWIAVKDFHEREDGSDLARKLNARTESGVPEMDTRPALTTLLSVDESGSIIETTFDADGSVVDEAVIASVEDLPVSEEYVDGDGRLVCVSSDERGNVFEQILDENLNLLETKILPSVKQN